jgi:hypothetical protein
MTDVVLPFPEKNESPRDVSINMMAMAVVTLERNVVAPLLPKTVWLDPPKTAPMLAPLPF